MPNNKPEDTLSPSVIQYQTLPYGWVNREIHQQINMMMTNVENNGAPWAYPQADRGNWIHEI